MANDIKRTLSDLVFAGAGAQSLLDLPRDSVMKELELELTLRLATGAAAGVGTLSEGGILSAIRRIEIVADGALSIWNVDPVSLWILNGLWNGAWSQRDALAIPAPAGSNTLQASLECPFALPFSENPNVTLLNAQALSSLQLRITWGAIGDLTQTPNDTTIAATTAITPTSHEILGLSPRSPFSTFKVTQIRQLINAASNALQVDLNRGNILRGLLFMQRNTLNGVLDLNDGILNEVSLESSELNRGLFVHRRVRMTDTDGTARPAGGFEIRNNMRRLYGVPDYYTVFAGQQQAPAGATYLTGFGQLEFMEDKRTSSAIRTQLFTRLNAILNVSAPGTTPEVVITQQEIIPAARPRAA